MVGLGCNGARERQGLRRSETLTTLVTNVTFGFIKPNQTFIDLFVDSLDGKQTPRSHIMLVVQKHMY